MNSKRFFRLFSIHTIELSKVSIKNDKRTASRIEKVEICSEIAKIDLETKFAIIILLKVGTEKSIIEKNIEI